MFWRREKKVEVSALGPILTPPMPPKPKFKKLLCLLKDAEYYDDVDKETSVELLKLIQKKIDDLI